MIRLGRDFAQQAQQAALREAAWQAGDFSMIESFAPHDLVVCSYTLGENEEHAARKVLQAAKIIAITEPGTLKGFGLIRLMRDEIIQSGGHLLAPCPRERACPMRGHDWCHFAQRVERSALHRRIKRAGPGYEDEKYAYLAATKAPATTASARVIRHPLRQAGYTQLQLCATEKLTTLTVTKKDQEAWKQARKTNWGDAWEK